MKKAEVERGVDIRSDARDGGGGSIASHQDRSVFVNPEALVADALES